MPLGSTRSFEAPETRGGLEPSEQSLNALVRLTVEDPGDDGEFKLPKMRSLVIMLSTNVLLQVSSLCSGDGQSHPDIYLFYVSQTTFFIIVSSGSKYAEHLGGSSTFSGLVIGIPTVMSGIALVPLVKLDGGRGHTLFLFLKI